jgi:hypothetical protein
VSRVAGAGGENSQRSVAVPGATAQKAILATRNGGPEYGGLFSAPLAKAMVPGPTVFPRKIQLPGPLHTSFCSTASKTVLSAVTVFVSTQPANVALTLSSNSCVKVK